MKIYVTQYALTTGIRFYLNAEVSVDSPTMAFVKTDSGMRLYFHKPHWHTSVQEALDRANVMRLAKIKSLRKSIEKVEAMSFGPPESVS